MIVGRARPLFSTNTRDSTIEAHYAVGPDGERFLINTMVEEARTPPIALVVGWPEELRNRE